MKHTFKKVVVLALAVLMCVSSIMPSAMAAENTCPGANAAHTATNCSYTESTTTEATCEATGVVMGKCNTCKADVVVRTVEAAGHDWDVTAASCDTIGIKTCKVCKKTEQAQAAPGHAWGEWVVNGGVCRVGEVRIATCTVCGAKKEDTMAEAHSWVVDEFVAPTRCGLAGYSSYVCANSGCDAERSEEIWISDDAIAHTWINWEMAKSQGLVKGVDPVLVAATCMNDGYRTEVCSVCELQRVVRTAKLAPNFDVSSTLTASYAHPYSTDPTAPNYITKVFRFVPQVQEDCCVNWKGFHAYWECNDCGQRFRAIQDGYTDYSEKGSDGNDHWKTREYKYKMNEVGTAIKNNNLDVDDATLRINDKGHHHWSIAEVSATCTTPGFATGECYMCGKTRNTTTAALGHLFAPDVKSGQTDIIKNVAAENGYSIPSNVNSYSWTVFVRENTKIKSNVVEATCTTAGSYQWRCLRKGCYDYNGNGDFTGGLSDIVTVPATGHTFSTEADDTASLAATCVAAGYNKYFCTKNCGAYTTEAVSAKGHKLQTSVTPATCETTGLSVEDCIRSGCDYEAVETVLPKDPANHNWKYMETAIPNCLKATTGTRYCENCGISPAAYEIPATGHKFLEGDDLLEAIETLVEANTTDEITVANYYAHLDAAGNVILDGTTSGSKVAVLYEQIGDCANVAKYKLNCLNRNCVMFQYKEVDTALKKGGHDVVIVYRNTADESLRGENGTLAYHHVIYDKYNSMYGDKKSDTFSGDHKTLGQWAPTGHLKSATLNNGEYTFNSDAVGKNYFWYCKNAGCTYARSEGGREATEIAAVANGHLIKDGDTYREVTVADVPDVNISKLTFAKAKLVKAPTDENGNITAIAVDIPGTTLVWRYVVDVSCEYDQVIAGGFWCVECQEPYAAGASMGCNVENAAKAGHVFESKKYNADCQNYGYIRKTCVNCDYTVVTNYVAPVEHAYRTVIDVKATCIADGYQTWQCATCGVVKTVRPADDAANGIYYTAHGHKNISGVALSESCLDPNANIDNRYCVFCATVIISDHACDASGICKYCGRFSK